MQVRKQQLELLEETVRTALRKQTDHSVIFEIASKYCISDSLVDHDGYSISSKRFLLTAADVAAKSLQSCPTLCDPKNSSPPGSPIPGILQARTLEWVAIAFSNA